jgi:DNA-binding transcriptional regulator YiaG
MAKIEGVIKAEIMRLAKREVRSVFRPLKREVWQMSTRLSALSKGMASLNRMAKELHLEEKAKPRLEATPEEVQASRLTPERIQGLRKKLGISQRELGMLLGASVGAVLSWEKGKFRPMGEKKATLVAVRKLKKREVKKLLAQKVEESKKGKAEKKPARRNLSSKKVVKKEKASAKRPKPSAKRPKKG